MNQERAIPRVVAVASGKGGVGKTLFSVSLADYAARQGMRTLLIDADLGLANADVMLGVSPQATMDDLLTGEASMDDVIVSARENIDLLAGGSGLQHLTRLSTEEQCQLLDALREAAGDYELLVLDVAAGIGDNVLYFVSVADLALIVLTPEITSLTDAYALIKVLSRDRGVRHFSIVVNQSEEFDARLTFRRLLSVCDRYLDVVLDYLGHLPAHAAVREAIQHQQPLREHSPDWLTQAIDEICARLLARPLPTRREGLHLFWEKALASALDERNTGRHA